MITGLMMAASLALVIQDDTSLRSAPKDSAPKQAVLHQGDALEIRGERLGYWQVYDHRRERGGYVRVTSVRAYGTEPESALSLLAIVQFLKDTPGSEALGIAHAALFLKAAPAAAITADVFDAIGTMGDRLARRASMKSAKAGDALAGHLDVAAGYGLQFRSFDVDGRTRVCYDGEAFRRVLALSGTDEQKARAALGLTRLECVDPAMSPVDRKVLDEWRVEILARVDTSKLPKYLAGRISVRRAATWAALSFERQRQSALADARTAANTALKELALADRKELSEDDLNAYDEAAVRVGASRWAAEDEAKPPAGLGIVTAPGQTGETCVKLVDATHDAKKPLLERCTFGVVWASSARPSSKGNALSLAVQPMDAWRELWVFHQTAQRWVADVLAPSTEPEVGYLEHAGWSPDGTKLLAVRESRVEGRFQKRFEIINVETLEVEKHADSPRSINAFYKWQSPDWKAQTVALR